MNRHAGIPSVRHVLGEGWGLFISGFGSVFPWILAAELSSLLPFANPPASIFTMDLSQLGDSGFWIRALLFGALQAFLYGMAVQRLAAREGAGSALRAIPGVLVAYLCYEVMVAFGLLLTFAMFMLGMFIIGPLAGLVLCILPLAPTAAASTAMALFIFPAVLEGKGPFVSLGESTRLAKTSWVTVSLVISVPAIVLLISGLIADAPGLIHAVTGTVHQLDSLQEAVSTEEVTGLLSGFKTEAAADRYSVWQVTGVLASAVAWWYTLAVCYAQYRDLKAVEKT